MVIGHQKQLEHLRIARDKGKLGHAYILSGPSRVGKKTAALEWLSGFFCQTLNESSAHPDFFFVEPLSDPKTGKKAAEITVSQIRELIRKLSLKPSVAPLKAAVVNDAHLMNVEAQNALLKTLEEPSGDAVIILVAQNSGRLLETIRSRCQILQFNFVSQKSMRDFINQKPGLNPNRADEIVRLSFGRPGRMVEFAADPQKLKEWQDKTREFARVIGCGLPEKFAYAQKIAEAENFDEELEAWQAHYRDLLLASLAVKIEETSQPAPKPQFVFNKQKIAAAKKTPSEIAAILEKMHNLGMVLQTTNASPRLAIENFMLEL